MDRAAPLLILLILLGGCGGIPAPQGRSSATSEVVATAPPAAAPLRDATPPPAAAPLRAATAAPTTTIALPLVATTAATPAPAAARFGYQVVNRYPHDPAAFTEGLVYDSGQLYESTGLNGRSSIRRVELISGKVLQQTNIAQEYFGEGLALVGDRLIQLTWQTRVGLVYNKDSLQQQGAVSYDTEGWGLAYDGVRLIRSDGSATLHFHDPQSFAETGRVTVTDGGQPVASLNELEVVRGEVWANIWQTDRIARIDPSSGRVTGWIDLTGLLGPQDRQQPVDVLNGIAYDPATDRLFVTGKLWPKLFEITVVPQP